MFGAPCTVSTLFACFRLQVRGQAQICAVPTRPPSNSLLCTNLICPPAQMRCKPSGGEVEGPSELFYLSFNLRLALPLTMISTGTPKFKAIWNLCSMWSRREDCQSYISTRAIQALSSAHPLKPWHGDVPKARSLKASLIMAHQ